MTIPAVTFEVLTPSEGAWSVMAVVGEEAMSELFSFRLAISVPIHDNPGASSETFARQLVGRFAKLTLAFDPETEGEAPAAQLRYGVVTRARFLGVFGHDAAAHARIDCTLAPRAEQLTLRKNTRIFQDLCAYEVISLVLAEHGLVHWWSLAANRYPRRKYCTQYDETDWAFVTRLLAEEGLAFFFMHVPEGTPADACNHVTDGGPSCDDDEPTDYVNLVGTVAEGVGAAAASFGGTPGAIGAAAGLAGSILRAPDADPDAITFGAGGTKSAGPAKGYGDVFCFVDAAGGLSGLYPSGADAEQPSTLELVLRESTNLAPSAREIFDLVPLFHRTAQKVTQRDHDFRRPLLELRVTADAAGVGASGGAKVLEVYEPQGDYDPPYIATVQAKARLEQLQVDGAVVRARSLSPRVLPGHVFSIDAGGSSTRHAAVAVRHRWIEPQKSGGDGSKTFDEYLRWDREEPRFGDASRAAAGAHAAAGGYQNELEMVGADTLYRPALPRVTPRATTDTAVVTGPAGTEIYTDKLGRVKVQFHWDREGIFDENTSCWLRVVHPWVGAGFGFQFIPRVGTEVLVTYVGGDPDRPVVTGALYDGTHPFPEPLPDRATRSAIRTQSSPGGGGFHEIVFEDASGDERLTIRSQSHLEVEAKGAHDLTVADDHRVIVGGDQRTNVTGDLGLGVGGKLVTQSGEDRTLAVGGSSTLSVASNRTANISGNSLRDVGGLSLQVSGEHDVTVVGGDRSVTVKGDAVTYVGGRAGDAKSHATTFVDGNTYLNAINATINTTGDVTIRGLTADGDHASKITLVVGTSSILVEHDKITLAAENVVISGSSALTATAQNAKLVGSDSTLVAGHDHHLKLDSHGGDLHASPNIVTNDDGTTVKLSGSDAKFTASGEAKIEAGSIKLNSGSGSGSSSSGSSSSSSTPPPPSTTPNVKIEFTHHRFVGQPGSANPGAKLASVPAAVSWGETLLTKDPSSGDALATSSEGVLQFHVPDGVHEVEVKLFIAKVTGENATNYATLYGPGPLVFRVIVEADDPPAGDQPMGQRIRLQNLGYDTGSLSDEPNVSDPDDPTKAALERFQEDEHLTHSEHIETDTKTRLEQMFGR